MGISDSPFFPFPLYLMKLNYKTFGSGPPLVICHGLFGMLDNWQTLAKKWADDFTVFIVDLRNHGKSPHDDEFSYEAMANDLQEFLNDNWMHKSHFLGHSMGGKAVMQLALMEPELIDKLVIVDMGTDENKAGHHLIFEALLSLPIDKIQSRREAEDHLTQFIKEPGVRLFLMKNLTRNPAGGFRWKMNLPIIHESYEEILKAMPGASFEGETLFIRGEKSGYLPVRLSEGTLQRFPEANQLSFDAGHWVHAEKPLELCEAVRNFLL